MGDEAQRPKVLVGACGSVAAVKVPEIVTRLAKVADVRVLWTDAAAKFESAAAEYNEAAAKELARLVESFQVVEYFDEDEWDYAHVRSDPVVHIELRKWADVFLIAPLSANSLAKLANGICDNLLTSVARAWDPSKPLIVAPAMNTFMWDHPLTARHLATLREVISATIVSPVSKTLACGDTGTGALATVDEVVAAVLSTLSLSEPSDTVVAAAAPRSAFEIRQMTESDKPRVLDLVQRSSKRPSARFEIDQATGMPMICLAGAPSDAHRHLRDITVAEDRATRKIHALACSPCRGSTTLRPFAGEARLRGLFNANGLRCVDVEELRSCMLPMRSESSLQATESGE